MASYKLIGQRNLRKYTEAKTSPVYAAAVEALGDDLTAHEIYTACRTWMTAKIPDLDNIVL